MGEPYTAPHNAPKHKPTELIRLSRISTIDGRGIWGTWIVDCRCGWTSPICSSPERAQFLWREHAAI